MWTNPAWSEPVQGYQSSGNSYQPVYSTQYAADPARFLQQSTQAGPLRIILQRVLQFRLHQQGREPTECVIDKI